MASDVEQRDQPMTRLVMLTALGLAAHGCSSSDLNPEDYDRSCTADDQCTPQRFLACGNECGDMAINTESVEQAREDYDAIQAGCLGVLPPSICRTDARSAACLDGQCTLLDVEGNALGTTVVKP